MFYMLNNGYYNFTNKNLSIIHWLYECMSIGVPDRDTCVGNKTK